MQWFTDYDDFDNAPEDNQMYLVTVQDGQKRGIDYIEYYRGEWCTDKPVVAWAKVTPFDN